MPITYRFKQRQTQLEKPFNKDTLKKLWKKKVRGQVRSMSIHDLHDFYDFHRRLDDNASKINERVLSGQYKVQVPLIYDLEKKFGICRHMIVLSPSDSLVLQALIQPFADNLISKAPSMHAYYSRDKDEALKLPHEMGGEYDGWFFKWKLYQREILLFTDTKKYIITTDLSNYYDSIRLRELRSVISSYINCEEVLLDLLFDTIENLSWRPDYSDSSSVIYNFEDIKNAESIQYLKEYLFPANKHKKGYPLSKFLILYNFCFNKIATKRFNMLQEIEKHIHDSWFLFWLRNTDNFS